MQWLSTVLFTGAAVAALVAILAAISSHRSADRAAFEGRKVASLRGRVLTAEGQLEALTTQHRKLSGRFYAALGMIERDTLQRQDEESPGEPGSGPEACGHADRDGNGKCLWCGQVDAFTCDNWRIAQIEGPKSEAASCECSYCVAMREQRRRIKETLVPKDQAGRIAEMRRGLAQR